MFRLPARSALIAACVCGTGCGARAPLAGDAIEPAAYPAAFQAAKDVLRDYEFELDRVDARAGVITTFPRASSGLATPWIPHGSATRDAFEGLAQFEQRTAMVEFVPSDGEPLEAETPREMRVSVSVERLYRPGRRVDATSVRLASFTADPRHMGVNEREAAFAGQIRNDPALADRIAAAIRLAMPAVSPAQSAPSE